MWSRKFPCCQGCGTDKVKHDGKGLCQKCTSAARYAKNPEPLKLAVKRYQLKHAEALYEKQRIWKEANPERVRHHHRKHHFKNRVRRYHWDLIGECRGRGHIRTVDGEKVINLIGPNGRLHEDVPLRELKAA